MATGKGGGYGRVMSKLLSLVILAVGIVAGLISAIVPIVRVSRTKILDALA